MDSTDSNNKYTEGDITKYFTYLLRLMINISFQQTIGIPYGVNCAPLLANLSIYSYETDFIQNIPEDKDQTHLARIFNVALRYIESVLSNNSYISQSASIQYNLLIFRLRILESLLYVL